MVDIELSVEDNVTIMSVSGRVDSMTAKDLGAGLTDAIDSGHLKIVLDLSQVGFMSSAGLRELVLAYKKVSRMEGGDLRIAQPSLRVREVLEMAGLDTIFLIFESANDAVESY